MPSLPAARQWKGYAKIADTPVKSIAISRSLGPPNDPTHASAVDVFAIGADHTVLVASRDEAVNLPGAAHWEQFSEIAPNKVRALATTYLGGSPMVFVRGTDDALWTNAVLNRAFGGGWIWDGYKQRGSEPIKALAAASPAPEQIDVIVIGTDDTLWTKQSVSNNWTGYTQLGTEKVKAVAATSSEPGRVDLFVIGTDDALWTKHAVNNNWAGYTQLGTEKVRAVAAASPAPGGIDVFVIGTDDALWTKHLVNDHPVGPPEPKYSKVKPGPAFNAVAAGYVDHQRNDVFVVGTDDGVVYWIHRDAVPWT